MCSRRAVMFIGCLTFIIHCIASDKELMSQFAAHEISTEVAMRFVECDLCEFILPGNEGETESELAFGGEVTDKTFSVSEDEIKQITQCLCAFIVGMCMVRGVQQDKLSTYVAQQVGIDRCVSLISGFVTQPNLSLDFPSMQPLTSVLGVRPKHLMLDSTVRLLLALRGPLIQEMCQRFGLPCADWLRPNILIKCAVESANAPTQTETENENEALSQCRSRLLKAETNLQSAHAEIEQWHLFYNRYLEQQQQWTNQIEHLRTENSRLLNETMLAKAGDCRNQPNCEVSTSSNSPNADSPFVQG